MLHIEEFIEPRQQVVTRHDRHFPVGQTGSDQDFPCRYRAAMRIHATRIGDDLEIGLVGQNRCQLFEDGNEIRGITAAVIPGFLHGQDGHGQFREVFKCEVVELSRAGQA